MLQGIGTALTTISIASAISQFFGIAVIVAILGLDLALRLVPKIAKAVRSLASRR